MNYIIKKYISKVSFTSSSSASSLALALVFASTFLLTNCSKYLEENPDSRVDPSTAEDYYAILTAGYPASWHLFTEIMSDNYTFEDFDDHNSATIESWFKPMYLWSDNYSLNLPVGPEFAWDSYYTSIYYSNVVLEGLEKDVEGEADYIDHIKGEALLVRAFNHFMLVNLYAKQYSAVTASDDLGVPYALETEKEGIVEYKRESIEYVYDQVEKDALDGLNRIDNDFIDIPKFHFTKEAAYAFMCRFYLYKGEWDKCIQYADSVLQKNSAVRDLVEDYDTYFAVNDFEGFSNDYFSTEKDNILLMNKVLEWNSYFASGYYANDFKDEFFDDDLRGDIFVFTNSTDVNWFSLKFISQYKDGQQYSNVAMLTTEEVLLNQAEAYVRKQNPDINAALSNLNKILELRYSSFSPLTEVLYTGRTIPAEVLVLQRIIEERRYELCYEGFRWFDLKRFNYSITHNTEFGPVNLDGTDLRYVLQIPEKELTTNSLMESNPR